MPTHIFNRVYFQTRTEDEADDVIKRLSGRDVSGEMRPLTFHRFVPMPPQIAAALETPELMTGWWYLTGKPYTSILPQPVTDRLMQSLGRQRPWKATEEELFEARRALENEKVFGSPTRYVWAIRNWGVDRDCWDVVVHRLWETELVLSFRAASEVPVPVARAMKSVFGEKLVSWLWSNEFSYETTPIYEMMSKRYEILDDILRHREWTELDIEKGIPPETKEDQ